MTPDLQTFMETWTDRGWNVFVGGCGVPGVRKPWNMTVHIPAPCLKGVPTTGQKTFKAKTLKALMEAAEAHMDAIPRPLLPAPIDDPDQQELW